MALFSKKTEEKKDLPAKTVKAPVAPKAPSAQVTLRSDALIMPRITEKGAYVAEAGCYVFNVRKDAGKKEIAAAVRAAYSVTPRKVTVVTIKGKRRMTRGTNRKGTSAGGKKAYVFLKKGEKIEIV